MEAITDIIQAFGGWLEFGGFAFGTFCFLLVMTGQLMPSAFFKVLQKDRDTLKEAIEKKDRVIERQAKTISLLSNEVGATIVQTMEGLPEVVEETEEEEQVEEIRLSRLLLNALKQWRR